MYLRLSRDKDRRVIITEIGTSEVNGVSQD